jgi:hypothetical protein
LYRNIIEKRRLDEAQEFCSALASYKSKKSAEILGRILNRRPCLRPNVDSSYLIDAVVGSILANKCEAYIKLEAQIKPFIKTYPKKDSLTLAYPDVVIRPETDSW